MAHHECNSFQILIKWEFFNIKIQTMNPVFIMGNKLKSSINPQIFEKKQLLLNISGISLDSDEVWMRKIRIE